jgi:hypothetical protein
MATLPSMTATVDNAFMTTWYTIRKEAADNITSANVVWAALKMAGCMKTQVGGTLITRSIAYGQKTAQEIDKTSTLSQEEVELETMAWWKWKYISTSILRTRFEDQENNGPDKIKSLVEMKLKAARQALLDKFEAALWNTECTSTEAGVAMQGLKDVVPSYTTSYGNYTYGNVSRYTPNTWWRPKYLTWTLPKEINLVKDMRNHYNTIGSHMEPPNLIITDQTTFELYEDFGLEKHQWVGNQKLIDLGFDALKFKGKDMIWTGSSGFPTGDLFFLNTNKIEIVYDPTMWFEMTEWKPEFNTTRRIAHILCAANTLTDEPRRHGKIYTTAGS